MDYKNLTEAEKNNLTLQYLPLIRKITNQYSQNIQCAREDIESYAYEGFAIAIAKYDPTRSSMNFTQYAAYAIRNNILTSLNSELRTVRMDPNAQKQAMELGCSSFNTISIDQDIDEDSQHARKIILSTSFDEKFVNGDVFEYLYIRLEDEFSVKDCDIFYRAFGLKTYDYTKHKDIAKLYGVSEGLISQKIKRMIRWIRADQELCEQLAELTK